MCHESVFAILHWRRDDLKYEARSDNMIIHGEIDLLPLTKLKIYRETNKIESPSGRIVSV